MLVTINVKTPALSLIQTGELLHYYGISEDLLLFFSFHCFEGEVDFSLVGVVFVLIADL